MLIKTTDESCINSDYIINLYLTTDKEEEKDKKYVIVARMIDGNLIKLKTEDTLREAEVFYNNFLVQANKR